MRPRSGGVRPIRWRLPESSSPRRIGGATCALPEPVLWPTAPALTTSNNQRQCIPAALTTRKKCMGQAVGKVLAVLGLVLLVLLGMAGLWVLREGGGADLRQLLAT